MSVSGQILAFLKSRDRDMKITIATDKKEGLPYCVSIEATILDEKIESWGVDESLDVASTKAAMELYERFIFLNSRKSVLFSQMGFWRKQVTADSLSVKSQKFLGTTSSGYAAHLSHKKATTSAINELIERHVLLKAELLQIKPQQVPMDTGRFRSIDGLTVDSFKWTGPLYKTVVVTRCRIKGLTFYGFGCGDKLESALEKSFLEIIPRLYYALNKKIESTADVPNVNLHFHANISSQNSNMNMLLESSLASGVVKSPKVDTHLKKSDFYMSVVENSPFPVVRVVSPLLQPHFLGEWSQDKLNLNAFKGCLPSLFPEGLHVVG